MPRRQKVLVEDDNGSEDEDEESDHSLEDSVSDAPVGGNGASTAATSSQIASTQPETDAPKTTTSKNDSEEDSETFHPTSSEEGGGAAGEEEEEEASAGTDNNDEDYKEDDSADDDDDESFDEEEDDQGYSAKSRRTSARKKAAPVRRKAPARKPPAKRPPAKKTAPAKKSTPKAAARTRAKRSRAKEESSSEEEEEEEEESDEYEVRPKPRSTGRGQPKNLRRTRQARVTYKEVGSSAEDSSNGDDDEEENGDDSEASETQQTNKSRSSRGPTGRPSRASAAKATAKMAQLRYKEEQASDAEEEEEIPKPRPRKKKKVDSDEEDFKVEENAEDDEDEVENDGKSSGEESFLQGVHSVPSDTQVGDADSSDFGEDEVSEDDGSDHGKGKPRTNGAKGKNTAKKHDNDAMEDDEGAEIEPTPTKARLSQEERIRPNNGRNRNKPPKIPKCPSDTDAITTDPLPPIHVCYLSPDGNSRQCFCLETLHKIATMSAHPQYRTNLSNQQQLTFLQPPHFRSAMSDELLDQIASRFGRQALDLNGEFYKRKSGAAASSGGQVDSDGDDSETREEYQVNFTRVHTDKNLFMHSWKDYQMRTMGSQDLYPCPVCYAVAHHRLGSPPSNSGQGTIPLPEEFKYDPMTVLGSVDNENFEIAAGFCFTKISNVKEHLRREHKCTTAGVDNALFFRYKLRAPDGLLQRFLTKNCTYGRNPKQGDMRRYWYEGNSESYIYLLYQIELFRSMEAKDDDESGSESDSGIVKVCKSYFHSFQDQAKDLWERISAPHMANSEDIVDFLDDGEVEEGEDEVAGFHQGFGREFDREEAAAEKKEDEELARYYTQKAAENDESENEDEYEPAEKSESEEEDEWVSEIRSKKRRGSLDKPKKAKARSSGRRLSSRKKKPSYAESSDEDLDSKEPPSSSKRAILEDSDSD